MIKNDKKTDKRYIITILMRNNVRNGSPTINAVDIFGIVRIKVVTSSNDNRSPEGGI